MSNPTRQIGAAVWLLMAGAAVAQTTTPVVTERQANQEARIVEGAKSGEATKSEISKLRAEQRAIRAQKRMAMAKADGDVTVDERAKPAKEQQAASRHIRKQKRDAQKRQ